MLVRIAAVAASIVALVAAPATASLPRPAHTVVIVEENHSYGRVVGSPSAPYINALARRGALFTNSYAITHPSLPNYFALFAGVTNTNGDRCPATGISRTAPNLGAELIARHLTFAGYSESLPERGFRGCWAGAYGRKHAPWVHFTNVPNADNLPFSDFPPFDRLPDVAFVIPNVENDMHSGSVAEGDRWLQQRLGTFIAWAMGHNTLVVLTWDEDDMSAGNRIPTIFYGPMVRPGRYPERITHYRVLRTIEDLYGLGHAGASASVAPIAGCWRAAARR